MAENKTKSKSSKRPVIPKNLENFPDFPKQKVDQSDNDFKSDVLQYWKNKRREKVADTRRELNKHKNEQKRVNKIGNEVFELMKSYNYGPSRMFLDYVTSRAMEESEKKWRLCLDIRNCRSCRSTIHSPCPLVDKQTNIWRSTNQNQNYKN